jgi:hypothetical protein
MEGLDGNWRIQLFYSRTLVDYADENVNQVTRHSKDVWGDKGVL